MLVVYPDTLRHAALALKESVAVIALKSAVRPGPSPLARIGDSLTLLDISVRMFNSSVPLFFSPAYAIPERCHSF